MPGFYPSPVLTGIQPFHGTRPDSTLLWYSPGFYPYLVFTWILPFPVLARTLLRYYPMDFVVLDIDPTVKEANYVPIILGRPFLATSNAIINCRNGVM